MQFRAELTPKPFSVKIKHGNKLMLIGSCFTEQIGKKLAAHKFEVLENPNGILFNPMSIANALLSYAGEKIYSDADLFCHNGLWASREHHTRFSDPVRETALNKINVSQQAANNFIKNADVLLVTLGSAFVYEWRDAGAEGYKNVAANCHKMPADHFNRRLTSPDEIKSILETAIAGLHKINPALRVIFTISPVRHLREGFVDNNRSKAALMQAVHALVNDVNILYFPAYELVIDDLRDYRFFAEDLAHPNYAATNYVWEKFVSAAVDENSQQVMKEINDINAAMAHKPVNAGSAMHKNFLESYLRKVGVLSEKYPYLNLEKETDFFSEGKD